MTAIEIHYQAIFSFVNKRVADNRDTEDLTQEIFYKLICSQNKGTQIEDTQKWLYRIAKNTVIDYYRKRKIRTEDISNLEWKWVENIDNFILSKEQEQSLKKYLNQLVDELPEDYRILMRMYAKEGMSQKEIADELGLNPVTVRSKIARGRAKLKKKITDCCHVIQGGKGAIIDYKPIANKCNLTEKKQCFLL